MAYSEKQREDIRRHIAEVCAQQIAEKGLQGVSGRSLASVLGKSVGWIYNFHSDFDAIILAANSLTLAELDHHLSATAAGHEGRTVEERFLALALTYLRFSMDNPRRWAALFEHQMPEGRDLSPEHKMEHYILFRHVEAPLAEIMPDADESTLRATARTIYSAVHGVVSLSLQGRLDKVPLELLQDQLRRLTMAFAAGYAAQQR